MQTMERQTRRLTGLPHAPRGSLPARIRNASPKVLLAHGNSEFRKEATRLCAHIDLELFAVSSSREAHRLACTEEPEIVVLDTNLPDESGFLACAKIKTQLPQTRVILLAEGRTPENDRYARFVGAEAVYPRAIGEQGLVELVLAMSMPVIP